MIKLKIRNELKIDNFPYEILESITRKILPKNISAKEIPIAYKAIKDFGQTNRRMYLFMNSDRINSYVIDVILKNKQKLTRSFTKKFLNRYIFSNGLDRIFSGIENIQKNIRLVLNRATSVFQEKRYSIVYQTQNFARHQVGDVIQPKTCLVVSLSKYRPNSVEVLYPFGKVTIQNADLSIAEALIKSLNASFEGIFEKHRQGESPLFRRIQKGDPDGDDIFEFVEDRYPTSPCSELTPPTVQGKHNIRLFPEKNIEAIDGCRTVQKKKSTQTLVFSMDPCLFSCYQIHSVFGDIVHRNRGKREADFLSRMFLFHFIAASCCVTPYQLLDTYLEEMTNYLFASPEQDHTTLKFFGPVEYPLDQPLSRESLLRHARGQDN